MIYLTIADDNGLLHLTNDGATLAEGIRTTDQLRRVLVAHGIDDLMVSSSIDFPEEFTTDEDVIAVCRVLRGVN